MSSSKNVTRVVGLLLYWCTYQGPCRKQNSLQMAYMRRLSKTTTYRDMGAAVKRECMKEDEVLHSGAESRAVITTPGAERLRGGKGVTGTQ